MKYTQGEERYDDNTGGNEIRKLTKFSSHH
jgi:hypothetical protein